MLRISAEAKSGKIPGKLKGNRKVEQAAGARSTSAPSRIYAILIETLCGAWCLSQLRGDKRCHRQDENGPARNIFRWVLRAPVDNGFMAQAASLNTLKQNKKAPRDGGARGAWGRG